MAARKKIPIREMARRFTSLAVIDSIRRGLISIIPVLMVGAFSLTVRYFPIDAYQSFITTFGGGIISRLLDIAYNATFGLLSVYMCLSVGYHYALTRKRRGQNATIGCPLASIACFVIFTGTTSLTTDTLGPKGMFISIIATVGASSLFCFLLSLVKQKSVMAAGADVHFNNSLQLILPLAVTVAVGALLNEAIYLLSGGDNLHGVFLKGMSAVFSLMGDGFASGILYVFISSVLWFFGIHGSDVLEGVCEQIFIPKLDINLALVAAGKAPTEILTKQFFDLFVLMGGCGSAMCLLIAILIFGRRRSNRGLARMAAFPMLFNINEIMVFGLPIIYNPVMLIPFLCVPLVCFLTSYAAMATGLVPLVTSSVEWTTPVILGGYLGTGSVMGSLLQLFNLALGVLIYAPFVRKYDEERVANAKLDYDRLVRLLRESEQSREPVVLTELSGTDGAFAKALAADIAHAIDTDTLTLHYQPQYDLAGRLIGAEALLRFEVAPLGGIYPPLVIQLAKESGNLSKLEKCIFRRVAADAAALREAAHTPLKLSANISGTSIQDREFERFLVELASEYPEENRLCIEITEQTAVDFNDELKARINRLREVGYSFAIDDFTAGNTSLHYLQENCIDLVKLDGSIVQNCIENPRSREIITMIVGLSHSFGFDVLAEFVSTEAIRDAMAEAGCTLYQGWLYSPAIPFDQFRARLFHASETEEDRMS